MTESELNQISDDGPRAYAPFTDEDIQRELNNDEYHDWLDARADEARRAMDADLEYQHKIVEEKN